MPQRNVPLGSNQTYWVKKSNGKGYTVWSTRQLQSLIEQTKVTASDKVVLKQSQY
jgi:hypothetical protein